MNNARTMVEIGVGVLTAVLSALVLNLIGTVDETKSEVVRLTTTVENFQNYATQQRAYENRLTTVEAQVEQLIKNQND